MSVIDEKNNLRKIVKKFKQELSSEDKRVKSSDIFREVEQLDEFIKADTILVYWSMADEVITHDFINKWWQEKTMLLPTIDGENLIIKEYLGENYMIPDEYFGILEPKGDAFLEMDKIDLIIVPGVAFDMHNNRMGRGRGYYDKLLRLTSAIKIGVCFNFQHFESIPVDEHDIPMNSVISEIYCKQNKLSKREL